MSALYFLTLITLLALWLYIPAAFASELLQGGVAEERRLPLPDWQRSILPTLTPGRQWDDSLLPRSFTQEVWVKIPRWLGGVWQTNGPSNDYTVSNGQLVYQGTTNVRASQTYGEQMDRNGDIWDLLRFPSSRLTEAQTSVSYFVTLGVKTGNTNAPGQYIRESNSIEISVDRASQRIQYVRNRQDRFTMALGADGTLTDTDEIIGPSGSPILMLQTKDIHVQQFAPVNIGPTTGINVRQSFRQFLTNNGMSNLLPTNR